MSVPQARRDRRLARFELRRRRLPVSGGSLSMVLPVSMADVLRRSSVGPRTEQPYWAEIWPAGLALARWLMRGPPLDQRRVLDLGCGLGVCGVAAGCRGAEVTFVDREADAVAFAEFNAHANGVSRARGLVADWGRDGLGGRYDLLLLADVTYRIADHGPLLRALAPAMAEAGEVLVVDPCRAVANDFVRRAAAAFDVVESRLPATHDGRRIEVRMLRLTAQGG